MYLIILLSIMGMVYIQVRALYCDNTLLGHRL